MGVHDRPYVGTWRLGQQKLVQHTPDALVYINGDVTLPGCNKCNGRIDFQKFLTEVSVDAGTDPGAASASISLSIPLHHNESFARDAQFILRPGLEIHVYMRGYFPVKGLYSNLAEPMGATDELEKSIVASAPKGGVTGGNGRPATKFPKTKEEIDFSDIPPGLEAKWSARGFDNLPEKKNTRYYETLMAYGSAEVIERYWQQKYPEAKVFVDSHVRAGDDSLNHHGAAIDIYVKYGNDQTVPVLQAWAAVKDLELAGRLPPGGAGLYLNLSPSGLRGPGPSQAGKASRSNERPIQTPGSSAGVHYDYRGYGGFRPGEKADSWVWADLTGDGSDEFSVGNCGTTGPTLTTLQHLATASQPTGYDYRGINHFIKAWMYGKERGPNPEGFLPDSVDEGVPNWNQALGQEPWGVPTTNPDLSGQGFPPPENTSLLAQSGLENSGLEDVVAYPYYHVFHGVVTQVDHSWSGGMSNISLSCGSMLHFWNYHTMSTQASIFGARPLNGQLQMSDYGHNFSGMHPYEIMYNLHYSVVGAAATVGWALSQKTSVNAKSEVADESFFSLQVRYWEKRFGSDTIKLRLYGATGEIFNSLQAAYLGNHSTKELTSIIRKRHLDVPTQTQNNGVSILSGAQKVLGRLTQALLLAREQRPSSSNSAGLNINVVEMMAFVSDIGQWANYNIFESAYESKLAIAQRVCEVTGFEFYQDVDGDLVFKPPLYNLDTSASRVYRIEDIDIISLSFSEKEPEATYAMGKNTLFHNLETGVNNEWGHQGVYIDYRLVAQFGWRPLNFETTYLNNAKSLFFAAVNRMTLMNVNMNTASLTIPLRPELRPGYPVYIQSLDCFFYCNSFAHSFSVGGQCTTALQLLAKRAKFYAPGDPTVSGIEAINLADTILPRKPLEVLDPEGRPRLAGFPNVVMALDPNTINPLFFIVGLDIEKLNNVNTIRNLLTVGLELGVIKKDGDGLYHITIPVGNAPDGTSLEPKDVYFLLSDTNEKDSTGNKKSKGKSKKGAIAVGTRENPLDLMDSAADYQTQMQNLKKRKYQAKERSGDAGATIQDLTDQLAAAEKSKTELKDIPVIGDAAAKKAEELAKKLQDAQSQVATDKDTLSESANDVDKIKTGQYWMDTAHPTRMGVALIAKIIETLRGKWLQEHPDYTNLDSTTTLLDLLSDKKAIFSNGQQPGYYRYYSSAHPSPEHQGREIIRDTMTPEGKKETLKTVAQIGSDWPGGTVVSFLPSNAIQTPWPGAKRPEAQLGQKVPLRGINVLTGNENARGGEIVPTSHIYELMFTIQQSDTLQSVSSQLKHVTSADFGAAALTYLYKAFTLDGAKVKATDKVLSQRSFSSIFSPQWKELSKNVDDAYSQAKGLLENKSKKKSPPGVDAPAFPLEISFEKNKFDTRAPIGTLKNGGSAQNTFNSDSVSLFVAKGGVALAASFYAQINMARKKWLQDLFYLKYPQKEITNAYLLLNTALNASWGLAIKSKATVENVRTRVKTVNVYSPVFPVSDDKGYEVIGSYRYGRGLSVSQDNVFNSLHHQDPLHFLSRQVTEELMAVAEGKAFEKLKAPVVQDVSFDPDGKMNIKYKASKTGGKVVYKKPRIDDPTYLSGLRARVWEELTRQGQASGDILEMFKGDPSVFAIQFMNFYADKGKDSLFKLPVLNTAYSLADLDIQNNKGICGCKAAEADVLLEGFKEQDFVQFIQPGTAAPNAVGQESFDQATQWSMLTAARASASWSQSQSALRGEVLDTKGSTLLQSIQNAPNFVDVKKELSARVDLVAQQADEAGKRLVEAAKNVGKAEK